MVRFGFLTAAGVTCAWVIQTAACGELIGADDYRLTGDGADGGTSTRELPLLPALPDSDAIAACEGCAAENCAAERQACLESERCTALLRCHGERKDPNCMYRCRDMEPDSATFEDYFACVFGPFERFKPALPFRSWLNLSALLPRGEGC